MQNSLLTNSFSICDYTRIGIHIIVGNVNGVLLQNPKQNTAISFNKSNGIYACHISAASGITFSDNVTIDNEKERILKKSFVGINLLDKSMDLIGFHFDTLRLEITLVYFLEINDNFIKKILHKRTHQYIDTQDITFDAIFKHRYKKNNKKIYVISNQARASLLCFRKYIKNKKTYINLLIN